MNVNGVRYDGTASDHVESYFIKATAPAADRALWLKATIFSATHGGAARAEGWAIAFDRREPAGSHHNVAVKHTLSYRDASFDAADLGVHWALAGGEDHLSLHPGRTEGRVSTNRSHVAWNLELRGTGRPFIPLPLQKMYEGPFPSSKTVTPAPDLRVFGEVVVNGTPWTLDGWRGMQGHNWGRGNAEQYAWTHCNQWNEPEDFVLEAVTARVRAGRFLTPMLSTVCVRHDGRDYAFNGPMQIIGTRAELGLRRYGFSVKSKLGELSGVVDAQVEDFVGLHYRNPVGAVTHCLNAKLANARIRFDPRDGHPVELSSSAAALEVGTLRSDHGVRMRL